MANALTLIPIEFIYLSCNAVMLDNSLSCILLEWTLEPSVFQDNIHPESDLMIHVRQPCSQKCMCTGNATVS